MAVKIGGKGGSMSDINMTPMIDIMLVLLIIFMIVQQGMQKGMEVQVPPTEETEDVAQAIDQIVLDIQPGNTYFLNQEPIPAGQLQQRRQRISRRAGHLLDPSRLTEWCTLIAVSTPSERIFARLAEDDGPGCAARWPAPVGRGRPRRASLAARTSAHRRSDFEISRV